MHDLGPEIRRAISGNLDEEEYIDKEIEEPMHRVSEWRRWRRGDTSDRGGGVYRVGIH